MWLERGIERRPLVFVEDHLYHTANCSPRSPRPGPISSRTPRWCALDRPGPDTDAAVAEWLRALSGAADRRALRRARDRVLRDRGVDLATPRRRAAHAGCSAPAASSSRTCSSARCRFFRPIAGGSRSTSRPRCAACSPIAPPAVRFLSNKRGYAATFGRDLLDAGFDPRDVMDKSAIADARSCRRSRRSFDRDVSAAQLDARRLSRHRGAGRSADADAERATSSGARRRAVADGARRARRRAVGAPVPGRRSRRAASRPKRDVATADRRSAADGDGLAVVDVGARLGPPDAERAELTNLAARHVHTLRGRLDDAGAIVTAHHAYRRCAETVSRVRDRPDLAPTFGARAPAHEGRRNSRAVARRRLPCAPCRFPHQVRSSARRPPTQRRTASSACSGPIQLISLGIGAIIGTGIFVLTGQAAAATPDRRS